MGNENIELSTEDIIPFYSWFVNTCRKMGNEISQSCYNLIGHILGNPPSPAGERQMSARIFCCCGIRGGADLSNFAK